ncbi:MAG: riboflavin biosynthesis protein RibF [Clostridiales bacterium]|jgi:riboflavin kinase/FMN adenylyltransferase|nr:riboflavin biosynthesis protein RibF [Clostridiales bacterium]
MVIINDKEFIQKKPAAVTIGKFEGLHLGHQKLIRAAREAAGRENFSTLVFSFAPHPLRILRDEAYASLFSDEEKAFLLAEMGVDVLLRYPFDHSFANIHPQQFAELIFRNLLCRVLVVGENFRFGQNRAGDVFLLRQIGEREGARVITPSSETFGGERISSSRVRRAIERNDFETARQLMGRPYFVRGEIAHGKELGRTIGFPTINIAPAPGKWLPPNGVYFTKTHYNGQDYDSLTNVGVNPTVTGKQKIENKIIETYLLDFDQWIYGETAQVFFGGWLRAESHFENLEALQNQLKQDVEAARAYHGKKDWYGQH